MRGLFTGKWSNSMKNLIVLFIALFVVLAVPSFFGSLGFAQGGGTVRILTDEVTANSESGQAIAIGWSDIENLNAQNTPQPISPTDGTWTYGIATAVLFIVVYLAFRLAASSYDGNPDYEYIEKDWQPAYEKQPDGTKRPYGPD